MKEYKPLIWMLVIVIVLWGISWTSIQLYYGHVGGDGRGTFGDMFGAVNSLFSGFAFAGIIYTILMQRKDLVLQSKSIELQTKAIQMQAVELELMKEETARMADELEDQRKLMNLQRVESMIFHLIKSLNTYVETITYSDTKGVKAIEEMVHGIKVLMQKGNNNIRAVELVLERNRSKIDLYLKRIIYILQFIHDTNIEESKKQEFADVLNMNLEDCEVSCIYWLCYSKPHELGLLATYGFKKRQEDIINKSPL